jgi:hypothetical protein
VDAPRHWQLLFHQPCADKYATIKMWIGY